MKKGFVKRPGPVRGNTGKPLAAIISALDIDGHPSQTFYHCPVCKKCVNPEIQTHCFHCGQAIYDPIKNPRKIYVVGSYKSKYQREIIKALEAEGYKITAYRNLEDFDWGYIDKDYRYWTPKQLRSSLFSSLAKVAANDDLSLLDNCDACLLILPCGVSSHMAAAYARVAGKKLFLYIPEKVEPELMYLMVAGGGAIGTDLNEMVALIKVNL